MNGSLSACWRVLALLLVVGCGGSSGTAVTSPGDSTQPPSNPPGTNPGSTGSVQPPDYFGTWTATASGSGLSMLQFRFDGPNTKSGFCDYAYDTATGTSKGTNRLDFALPNGTHLAAACGLSMPNVSWCTFAGGGELNSSGSTGTFIGTWTCGDRSGDLTMTFKARSMTAPW